MKKVLVISFILLLGICANARTVYDETGRNIVKDGTLRSQKQEAQTQIKRQTAAAARLNYDEDAYTVPTIQPNNLKSNYIQDRQKK